MPGGVAIALMIAGLTIGLGGLGASAVRAEISLRRPDRAVALVMTLALSAPVLAAIFSAVSESVFLPRNLIASSPGLALSLGWIVTRPRWRGVWVPATALLLAGFAVAGSRMVTGNPHRPDYKAAASFIARHGGNASNTVDAPSPGPGPFTSLDAAMAPGEARPRVAPLRLGRASQPAQLRADRPGGPGQFAPLPVPPAISVAHEAQARTRGRTIFLVVPGKRSYDALRAGPRTGASAETYAAAFVHALPSRYRPVEAKVFPGLFGFGDVSVFVLR
jgi:hypothetical protein